jgi:hypothetical protein
MQVPALRAMQFSIWFHRRTQIVPPRVGPSTSRRRCRCRAFGFPACLQHRRRRAERCGDVGADRPHQHRRHRLVAAAHQHRRVDRMTAQHLLDFHRQQVSIQHRRRLHQHFAQRHHRHFDRKPAGLQDPTRTSSARSRKCEWHVFSSLQVFRIAITGPAHALETRPMAEGAKVVGAEPALAAELIGRTTWGIGGSF